MNLLIGIAGFLLYFVYDINSVKYQNTWLQKGFLVGTLLVAGSTGRILWQHRLCFVMSPVLLLQIVAALCFLLLLVYTLFFAIPFQETYVEDNGKRMACTTGVYGLCRHPGVLWFAGLYICLAFMMQSQEAWIYAIGVTLMNIGYIILQDLWTFPQTFYNYTDYKKETPFLIPNGKSIKSCLSTLRR